MALATLFSLSALSLVAAQTCMPLTGSTQCSGFSSQSINPSNLTSQYPFFSSVTDVTSFDNALANYVETNFRTVKYNTELGCTNTTSAWTLQYATTFLCSVFTQRSYLSGCVDSSITNRMACQATCLQFAVSENLLVANPSACGTTNTVGAARQGNLTYDFTACTDWTTLISNNTATCVLGQNNEGNCGFGSSSMGQLCNYCDPSLRGGFLVDSCCAQSNTNLGSCGYTLQANQVAASPTPLPSSAFSTATASQSTGAAVGGSGGNSGNSGSSSSGSGSTGGGGISKGAIAGAVIGSIVGAALLLALLLFCLARRRRSAHLSDRGGSGGAALLGGGAAAGKAIDNEKAEKGYASSSASDSGKAAAAGKKLYDAPPSPASSGTPGLSSSDAPMLSGKSSPTSSFGLSTALAGAGVGALAGAGAATALKDKSESETGAGDRPVSGSTAGTGSSNERNLVSSVRDQYSSADITPGTEVVAIYAYSPNLPDELRLEPDSVITVKKIYDDGWAVGSQHKADGSTVEGAFPLVVCTVVGADGGDNASTNSSYSSRQAETAREGASQSNLGHGGGRSSASGRSSSIGHTSFESAQTGTSSPQRSGFFTGLLRRNNA